jgi:hypothetical protein
VYFSQKLSSLETSTTVYYSTTTSGYYATTSGVCKNSVKIPSYCTTPLLPSSVIKIYYSTAIDVNFPQQFSRISPFQHSVFKSNPAGTGLEKEKNQIHI